jgi:hypothetical protein
VIVVAGKRWQGDATASYRRGTDTNGVQRSKDLTVISQEIFDRTPSTYPVDWCETWDSGGRRS